MQTTEETHRYFRHTLSLTVWHKLGLPDPNCCMIPLCWCVAVVSGGHDSLIEVGVIKMQWENWAAYSDDGTLGSGVPWSSLGYTVQWTVMEINVHWEEGLSDQSKQQWLFPKVAGRGEGKMLYGLWLIPLWEHRAHLLGHFKKYLTVVRTRETWLTHGIFPLDIHQPWDSLKLTCTQHFLPHTPVKSELRCGAR